MLKLSSLFSDESVDAWDKSDPVVDLLRNLACTTCEIHAYVLSVLLLVVFLLPSLVVPFLHLLWVFLGGHIPWSPVDGVVRRCCRVCSLQVVDFRSAVAGWTILP